MSLVDYFPDSDGPQSRIEVGGRRILCKGGGGGGSSTTVQSIPDELKPLASKYTTDAINLSNTPYQAYNGERYADLNGLQVGSAAITANRALGGSATMDNGEYTVNQMMGGGTNPYLDGMVQRAQDSVTQNMNNAAFNSGSYGNSGLMEAYGKALGDTAGNMYGQQYNADQARRLQAAQMAPTFGNAAYTDADKLMGAGQVFQDQAQQQNDFNYAQFQEQQNDPYKKLAAMSGVFNSNLGGTSTTQQSSSGGGK